MFADASFLLLSSAQEVIEIPSPPRRVLPLSQPPNFSGIEDLLNLSAHFISRPGFRRPHRL